MSFTRASIQPLAYAPAPLMRAARVVVWAVINAALLFAEQVAELAAPFLFLAGTVWYAIPHALAAITLDGPANDMLHLVRSRVPHTILMGDTYVSASSLIYYAIICVAVVAICRTASTAITSLLLDRR